MLETKKWFENTTVAQRYRIFALNEFLVNNNIEVTKVTMALTDSFKEILDSMYKDREFWVYVYGDSLDERIEEYERLIKELRCI